MIVIGIVGGVASGKSTVARMFESFGAIRLDADALGHEVLQDPSIQDQLIDRWGTQIVDATGRILRPMIAERVFGSDPKSVEERRFLESVTHPQIAQRLEQQLGIARTQGVPAVVLDAAVMFEAGWDRLCDYIVLVDVPRPRRKTRAHMRGWTSSQFESREASQWPVERKRQQVHTIIDNSGSLEETFEQVKAVWSTWKVDRD